MDTKPTTRHTLVHLDSRYVHHLSFAASIVATAIGAVVLLGWILGSEVLKGLGGSITMKANAAIGLMACGVALGFVVRRPPGWSTAAAVLATLAGTIGALTLLQHLAGWNLRIDQLLFTEPAGAAATTSPGRMGPNASLSLILIAFGLLSLRQGTSRSVGRAQLLACSAAVLALLALTGYWYGARALYDVARITGIAWPTAVAFFALALGVLFARTDVGPVAALLGERPGSIMARRLLPAAVALPFFIGYLRILGQDAGLYDTGFGAALFAIVLAITLVSLIWRNAQHVNALDAERQHAEAAMLASEASFATMFRSLPVAVVLNRCDDGTIVDVNDAYTTLTGYTRGELIGRTGMDLNLSPDLDSRTELLASLRRGEPIRDLEVRFTPKVGHPRDVLTHASLVQLRGTAYMLWAVADITERKRAEESVRESENRFRHLADHAPVMIFLTNDAKRCTWVNEPWLRFVGRTLEQEIGLGWPDSLHPDDRGRCFEIYSERFDARAPLEMEYRIRRHDGVYRWVLSHGVPVFAGDAFIGYIGSCIDITDRKELEGQQAAAREAAESANHLKDQFLATLSHELRTPLNAILGYARMLRNDVIAPEKRTRAIEIIERNALAQTQLVEDLLDISRVTTGRLRFDLRPIRVLAPLREALESVRPAAEAKGIIIDLQTEAVAATVNGDSGRLRQVFWNLLSNAVKFTPPGGRLLVTLAQQHDSVLLTIRDSGVGIAPEFLPHVFEPFRQADAHTSREHGGLGLGLAICKQLVELHGGTISVSSDGVGHGSTFSVRLPQAASSVPEAVGRRSRERVFPVEGSVAPGSASRGRLADLDVLVVDDQEDNLDMLRQVLEHAGAKVRTATSAADALDQWRVHEPDLLVSDIGLPGVDGYELLRQIRANAALDGSVVPALAVTAYAMGDDRAQALAVGFQGHIAKPIDPDAFIAAAVAVTRQNA